MELHGLTVEQKIAWERDGYLAIENLLTPEEVSKYNTALDRAFENYKSQDSPNPELANLANINQLVNLIEWDDAFLDLMEHPRTMQIMRDLIADSFMLMDNDGLVKPPHSQSHTLRWHRDADTVIISGGKRQPFLTKIFYYFNDVSYDGGCLALVPGSVHLPNDELPTSEKLEDMPGHKRMNFKAGTGVIFNSSTYHVALNNFSDQPRRNAYFTYAPTFMRPFSGYEASDRLKTGANTKLRQMLFGMHPWVSGNFAFQDK